MRAWLTVSCGAGDMLGAADGEALLQRDDGAL